MREHNKMVKIGLALAVVLACGAFAFTGDGTLRVTAYFAQFKGIYVGDDVTALGVPIGSVVSVDPEADRVKVVLEIDSDHPVPADVRAAVVAPSLVSVRAVVLGPIGSDGPPLEDGATIPMSRTAIPVEWDDVKDQLVELSTALGPRGANKGGATSELISSSADFLDGTGQSLNTTITDVSEAMSTLADNSGDLFATVRNLQVFVTAIKGSDAQVRLFNQRLAEVSAILDSDRFALEGALHGLRQAFVEVKDFVNDNKDLTVDTLRELRVTTSVLADNRQKIADILQVAPTGVSNFYQILDPRGDNGTLVTGELAVNNLQAPAQIICGALLAAGGDRSSCQQVLTPLFQYFAMNAPPIGIGGVTNNGAGDIGTIDPGEDQIDDRSTTSSTDHADLLGQLDQLLGGH
ncbi:MCE family protein [Nocardioides humilatus]|uniref:MCE family protein n=1 Tax=Nocardioides humilatus TaxID=2607660 RepID=A0A5B1LMI3_9ACTN|nr:MCE family protein [Nocardioides humilatus]KAA1421891.1 MCE family protein [Nocardioides humilatus]